MHTPDGLKSSFPSPRRFVRCRAAANLLSKRNGKKCEGQTKRATNKSTACFQTTNRKRNGQNKNVRTIGRCTKQLTVHQATHRAMHRLCENQTSEALCAATGTLTFYRIPQPVMGLRSSFLDEQKAAIEAEQRIQPASSTENQGAHLSRETSSHSS